MYIYIYIYVLVVGWVLVLGDGVGCWLLGTELVVLRYWVLGGAEAGVSVIRLAGAYSLGYLNALYGLLVWSGSSKLIPFMDPQNPVTLVLGMSKQPCIVIIYFAGPGTQHFVEFGTRVLSGIVSIHRKGL